MTPMTSRKPDRGAFRPWRGDFLAAGGFALVGCWMVYRGFAGRSVVSALLGMLFGATMLYSARWAWRNGMQRWHGKSVEAWAVRRLGELLTMDGIAWEAGVVVPGLGDVDLVAHPFNGAVTVEIKSFETWRGGVLGGRCAPRELAAIQQAQAQADRLGAIDCVLWLPRAKPTLLQRVFGIRAPGVRVVLGGEWAARRIVRRHHPRLAVLRSLRDRARRSP